MKKDRTTSKRPSLTTRHANDTVALKSKLLKACYQMSCTCQLKININPLTDFYNFVPSRVSS